MANMVFCIIGYRIMQGKEGMLEWKGAKMTIKPGKELIEAGVAYLGVLTIVIVLYIRFNVYLGLISFFCGTMLLGCTRQIISLGKTLVMDEKGCTVSFLWYEKKYKWNELQVKRIEDYSKNCKRRWHISDDIKVAVFSPYKIYKKGQWTPDRYSMYIHPFSVFYVYLIPESELKRMESEKVQDGYLSYVAEEKEFLQKMKEWNVGF